MPLQRRSCGQYPKIIDVTPKAKDVIRYITAPRW
jgi:hypothetical protein